MLHLQQTHNEKSGRKCRPMEFLQECSEYFPRFFYSVPSLQLAKEKHMLRSPQNNVTIFCPEVWKQEWKNQKSLDDENRLFLLAIVKDAKKIPEHEKNRCNIWHT